MNDRARFAQYDCEVVVKMVIVINDEEIAETEVGLLSDSNGNYNVDDAIGWLGKAERHYIPSDIQARYDEFMENQFEQERENDYGRKQRSSDSETTA